MSLQGLLSRSLCILSPSFAKAHYKYVRPHHLLVLYAAVRALASTSVVKTLCSKILSLLSEVSEQAIPLIHAGVVPDFLIRFGIRVQLRDHLNILKNTEATKELSTKMAIVEQLHNMPIAVATDEANQQHYEVPAKFYDLCLGPRKKYSSGLWPDANTTFEESEVLMLDLYCERAGIENGMSIVDLGCGWGSLTLHLAERFPDCKITGISNSHSQRDYILKTAAERGYNVQNITIVTVRT
jgi:cyclopropane-fatty-acyl-phospholipid synthase